MVFGRHNVTYYSAVLLFGLVLSACGGGKSGGSTAKPAPTAKETIQQDPSNLTTAELKKNFSGFARSLYQGSSSDAPVSGENIQKAAKAVIGSGLELPFPPYEVFLFPFEQSPITTDVNSLFSCAQSGTVEVQGKLNQQGFGNLELQFNNCSHYSTSIIFNGKGVITISSVDVDSATVYFDEVSITYPEKRFIVSGYYEFSYDENQYHSSNHVIYQKNVSTGESQLIDVTRAYSDAGATISAEVYTSSVGKITLETLEPIDSYYYPDFGKIAFKGAQNHSAWLELIGSDYYGSEYLAFLIDNTGDGNADVGAYYGDSYEFFAADMAGTTLVAIADLGFSPEVGQPYLQIYAPKTTDTLSIEPGYIYDRDTPTEDLSVSYEWAINDTIVKNNTGTTLAPYQAKYGDIVTVVTIVSDGTRSSRSSPLSIVIQDSPAVLSIQSLPESINTGATLTFMATVRDPDLGEEGVTANMVSAPTGASINEDGLVTWSASNATLFNVATVYFSFELEGSDEVEQVSVNVISDSIPLPIARSGIEVPINNSSMQLGSFTHADSKEALLTDGGSRLFTVRYDGASFVQTWMYPYELPSKGGIRGVHAFNLDEDEELEVYAVTEHGISLLSDTVSTASLVWQTENFIRSSVAKDLDEDGTLEVALLLSSSSYSSSSWELVVLRLSSTPEVLFSKSLSGKSTYEVSFGNVDADSAQELVISSGWVYDTSTWENQWFRGDGFGDQYVTTGDLDNDGIDEIIAGSSWGSIHIYSSPLKTLLYSHDNFNTCVVKAENVDEDANMELLVGDCQWGNMTAYNWTGSALEQAWALGLNGHGSKGLAVGNMDDDADLEIMWGTGQSSSGKDSLILANIGSTPVIEHGEADSIQLGQFVGAGWAEITPGDEKAVFVVVGTNSGYDGQALTQMAPSGVYSLESLGYDNWEGGRYALATDFNSDGFGDLFLATAELYSGAFAALQLNDMSEHWSFTGSYDTNIEEVDAFDVNGDDLLDALYVDGSRLNVMDIENEVLIDTLDHTSHVVDFAVTGVAASTSLIATSTSTNLELWQGTGAAFVSLATSNEHSCSMLEFGNVDEDSNIELICITGGSYYSNSSVVVYDWNGEILTVQSEYVLDVVVTDIEFNQSDKTLLVAVDSSSDYYSNIRYSRIQSISLSTGLNIWSGAAVLGRVSHRSMHYRPNVSSDKDRLMFGTDKAMYLVH